jgi:hypothetical protein
MPEWIQPPDAILQILADLERMDQELEDQEQAEVQAAWDELQAVPSYVERDKSSEE